MTPLRTRLTVLVCVGLLAFIAGEAWAYWVAGASGSGVADTDSRLVRVTALVGGDAPDSTLVPGGTAAVAFRVVNPYGVPLRLTRANASGPVTADANHPGCTANAVTMTAADPGLTVAANGALLVQLPAAAAMDLAAPAACEGATFSIPITVEGRT
jgi:hypothetical protein